MPDDRLVHPRARQGQKIASLSYLESWVWLGMQWTADDYGVLPDVPALIRGPDIRLRRESEAEIRSAMDHVIEVGLFLRFEHQGEQFLCDPTWQEYQKVHYPKRTYYPIPSPETFLKCSKNTQKLFQKRLHPLKRADHRLKAKGLRLTAQGKEGGKSEGGKSELRAQARTLLEFLNEKTGHQYPVNGKLADANLEPVMARLKDGATVEQCRGVIARKARQWQGTEQAKFLRPETLFGRKKFAAYIGERGE